MIAPMAPRVIGRFALSPPNRPTGANLPGGPFVRIRRSDEATQPIAQEECTENLGDEDVPEPERDPQVAFRAANLRCPSGNDDERQPDDDGDRES